MAVLRAARAPDAAGGLAGRRALDTGAVGTPVMLSALSPLEDML